jgi:hypothetical protein
MSDIKLVKPTSRQISGPTLFKPCKESPPVKPSAVEAWWRGTKTAVLSLLG